MFSTYYTDQLQHVNHWQLRRLTLTLPSILLWHPRSWHSCGCHLTRPNSTNNFADQATPPRPRPMAPENLLMSVQRHCQSMKTSPIEPEECDRELKAFTLPQNALNLIELNGMCLKNDEIWSAYGMRGLTLWSHVWVLGTFTWILDPWMILI